MDRERQYPQPAARSILRHRRLGKPGDRRWLRPIRGNSRPQWSELRFQFSATRGRWVSDRDAYAHPESKRFTGSETASNSATALIERVILSKPMRQLTGEPHRKRNGADRQK